MAGADVLITIESYALVCANASDYNHNLTQGMQDVLIHSIGFAANCISVCKRRKTHANVPLINIGPYLGNVMRRRYFSDVMHTF